MVFLLKITLKIKVFGLNKNSLRLGAIFSMYVGSGLMLEIEHFGFVLTLFTDNATEVLDTKIIFLAN